MAIWTIDSISLLDGTLDLIMLKFCEIPIESLHALPQFMFYSLDVPRRYYCDVEGAIRSPIHIS